VSGDVDGQRTSLWRLPATRSMVAGSALGFTGYWLTLASLPAYAVGGGTSEVVAGSVTAVFLVVTIAVQAVVPALTERFGAARVLVAGLLALGVPAPLYALDDGLGWLLWISAVRGVGFAILTVLGSVLAGRIVPPERRGEALGLYGLSVAVPNLVAVPAGVALVLHGAAGWMAWLAALPVLAVPFVPGLVRGARPDADDEPAAGAGRRAALRALAPSAVLFVATLAGGGVITYLPIERPSGALASTALLVVGATGAAVRWPSGVLADRVGTRLLLPGSLLCCVLGLAGVAAGLRIGDWLVLLGAGVFGVGFGAVQNLTLVTAFARAGAGGATAAGAVWNALFDAGTATGALGLGVVAAALGLPGSYLLVCAALLLVLPAAVVSTRRPAVSRAPGRRSPAASG
jgi:predicted MFS family arabinose efflux permease